MPLVYEYRCSITRNTFESWTRADRVECPYHLDCYGNRIFHFRTKPQSQTWKPHFNISLGRWVNSRQDYLDGLKIAGEEASRHTGLEHNYEPVDYNDRAAVGITDEAYEETKEHDAKIGEKVRRELGDYKYVDATSN